MKINLFAREIELIKVEENAEMLNTGLRGVCKRYEDKIYFGVNIPFQTVLHEIKHFYASRSGISQLGDYPAEVDCDTFGYCIDQLMLENGDDIFIRLKRFAEEKQ